MVPDTEFEVIEEQITEAGSDASVSRSLVLYNDDINTFDFVIESLVEICKHDLLQAEQCTYIVHYNGKCAVKEGSYRQLNPMRIALCERGLSAVIK